MAESSGGMRPLGALPSNARRLDHRAGSGCKRRRNPTSSVRRPHGDRTRGIRLTAGDAAPTDQFGASVAIDGQTAVIGAILKGDAGGRTYLGFEAPPGHPQDREILSSTNDLMTMRFIDPDANRRYGTFVYVRCRA